MRTTENFVNCVAEWDTEKQRGCLWLATSDDKVYESVESLQDAILETMEYGGYDYTDCSWFCGNEQELHWLASVAGLDGWVEEQENRLRIG